MASHLYVYAIFATYIQVVYLTVLLVKNTIVHCGASPQTWGRQQGSKERTRERTREEETIDINAC